MDDFESRNFLWHMMNLVKYLRLEMKRLLSFFVLYIFSMSFFHGSGSL